MKLGMIGLGRIHDWATTSTPSRAVSGSGARPRTARRFTQLSCGQAEIEVFFEVNFE